MPDLAVRLSWKQASLIIALATIVPPYTTFLYGFGGHSGGNGHIFHVSVAVYALFWAIYPPGSSMSGLQVLNEYGLPTWLSLGFFNIVFALQVIRFIRGEAGRRSTLLAGALTIVLPIISLIVALPTMISIGAYAYIGPIPLQLATGLLLMHLAGPKEPTAPW